jgi:rhodanese-related sulfurtransferase
MRVPRPAPDEPGLILVDTTWGIVQPMELAPGVRAIGELELIAHLQAGGVAFDVRLDDYLTAGTIPGARSLPHHDLPARIDEVPTDRPFAVFCNGPQCPAPAEAVARLLAAGSDPTLILYYRGGIQDWMALGYRLVAAER